MWVGVSRCKKVEGSECVHNDMEGVGKKMSEYVEGWMAGEVCRCMRVIIC